MHKQQLSQKIINIQNSPKYKTKFLLLKKRKNINPILIPNNSTTLSKDKWKDINKKSNKNDKFYTQTSNCKIYLHRNNISFHQFQENKEYVKSNIKCQQISKNKKISTERKISNYKFPVQGKQFGSTKNPYQKFNMIRQKLLSLMYISQKMTNKKTPQNSQSLYMKNFHQNMDKNIISKTTHKFNKICPSKSRIITNYQSNIKQDQKFHQRFMQGSYRKWSIKSFQQELE